MKLFLYFCIILVFPGCTKQNLIAEWQTDLQKNDPRLENLLLQQNGPFFVSLNDLKELDSYAFFYKKQISKNNANSIETWIETYQGDKKIILDAGHAVGNGIYFKQSDCFNKIVFIYRENREQESKIVLIYDKNRWQ